MERLLFSRRWHSLSEAAISSLKAATKVRPSGLLGHRVKCPADIDMLSMGSIQRSQSIISSILSAKTECLNLFDDLSNSICSVADWAGALQSVHPDMAYRDVTEDAFERMSQFIEDLNINRDLYEKLRNISNNCDLEGSMLAESLISEFEQSGINLEGENRRNYIKYMDFMYVSQCVFCKGCDSFTINSTSEWELQSTQLHMMTCARHQVARTMNYESFASWTLKNTMAGSKETVSSFLRLFSKEFSKKFTNILDLYSLQPPLSIKEAYKLKQKLSDDIRFDAGYFFDFYSNFIKDIYDIELRVDSIPADDTWGSQIIKVSINCLKTNQLLGVIYLDPYYRENKPRTAAHYTLFGRKILSDGCFQIPRVYLNLTFGNEFNNNFTLCFDEMKEFFHEMGHAFHSILYTGKYQHLSGTRCHTDIAEVPSILMEKFLFDWRVFSKCQNEFGEEASKRLCLNMQRQHDLTLVDTLIYSKIDHEIHSKDILFEDMVDIIVSIYDDHSVFLSTVEEERRCIYYTNHFANYGSKYYSYLWSEACSCLLWRKLFAKDPFCKKSHEKFRSEFLSLGAIKTSNQIMESFWDSPVTPDVLVGQMMNEIK